VASVVASVSRSQAKRRPGAVKRDPVGRPGRGCVGGGGRDFESDRGCGGQIGVGPGAFPVAVLAGVERAGGEAATGQVGGIGGEAIEHFVQAGLDVQRAVGVDGQRRHRALPAADVADQLRHRSIVLEHGDEAGGGIGHIHARAPGRQRARQPAGGAGQGAHKGAVGVEHRHLVALGVGHQHPVARVAGDEHRLRQAPRCGDGDVESGIGHATGANAMQGVARRVDHQRPLQTVDRQPDRLGPGSPCHMGLEPGKCQALHPRVPAVGHQQGLLRAGQPARFPELARRIGPGAGARRQPGLDVAQAVDVQHPVVRRVGDEDRFARSQGNARGFARVRQRRGDDHGLAVRRRRHLRQHQVAAAARARASVGDGQAAQGAAPLAAVAQQGVGRGEIHFSSHTGCIAAGRLDPDR
jgi:hypothetical protein